MADVSYTKHNEHYVKDSSFLNEKLAHQRNNIEDFKFLYQSDVHHGDVLDSTDFKTAVDIAKKIYPDQKKVKYINGFAEEELSKIKLTKPTLFSTLCVLTHLEDETVISILESMNKISSTGSVFTASEPWGPEHKESAWNIRPPEWWVENLPNWEFEFYNDYVLPHPTDHPRYKGFIATKL